MPTETRSYRQYDHRFRNLVRRTGDIGLAVRRGVPRSTTRGWLTNSRPAFVTLDACDMEAERLRQEVVILRKRVARLIAVLRIVVVVLRLSGYSINRSRIPNGHDKSLLLRAIARSRDILPLRTVLRVIDLSQSRFHSWRRDEECGLDDLPSCPRMSPQQLTADEVDQIKVMVCSDQYRHVPANTLAVLAQRLGKVFASASTWYRLVRTHNWRRPRQRVHPPKPKVGIRARQANEVWHVDTTLVRLLDGSKAYLHAIIDNFSRRILAWRVHESFVPAVTAELLIEAALLFATTFWSFVSEFSPLRKLHLCRFPSGFRRPSGSLVRSGTSLSDSLRMNRFRNVSVRISKRVGFAAAVKRILDKGQSTRYDQVEPTSDIQ